MICALVTSWMGDKGANATLIKLVAGLFLAFTLIKPLVSLDLSGIISLTDKYQDIASDAVQMGESQTRNALSKFIKQRTEAYILDKAQALNTVLEVEVTLSDDDIPVPVAVNVKGKVSPYAKGQLQSMITEDIGIEKEKQTWT